MAIRLQAYLLCRGIKFRKGTTVTAFEGEDGKARDTCSHAAGRVQLAWLQKPVTMELLHCATTYCRKVQEPWGCRSFFRSGQCCWQTASII